MKFLDLGLDDGDESDTVGGIISKQNKYQKEFEKQQFKFETQLLDLPRGKDGNMELISGADSNLALEEENLDKAMKEIVSLLTGSMKTFLMGKEPLIFE